MKSKWLKTVLSILVAFAFGVVGFFAALWTIQSIESGKLALWQLLGKPPTGATKFVGYQSNFIYVETSSENTFRCCTQGKGWEKLDAPIDLEPYQCKMGLYDISTHPAFSYLPNEIKDCTFVTLNNYNEEWVLDEEIFVILTDGTVWKWHHYSSIGQSLGILCGMPLLTTVLGWSILGYLRRKKV